MIKDLIKAYGSLAAGCEALGDPFQAALARHAAQALGSGDDLEGLFEPWKDLTARELMSCLAPLVLLGALHDRALADDPPDLAAAYPSRVRPQGDPDAAWRIGRKLMGERRDWFAAFMSHEPQTNEPRRAACLLAGFLTIARETNLPLRTLEIGASGGLNVNWDAFHYDLGNGRSWGASDAKVRLQCDWSDVPADLTETQLTVALRAACDRRPVDITDPDERRRLLAYVWPGQLDRVEQGRAAGEVAAHGGVKVDEADAAEWIERNGAPVPGVVTVVYHSVFWQYLPEATKTRLKAAIEAYGESATSDAPFAWLSMEPSTNTNIRDMALTLRLWPGGEPRVLAAVHPHGAWLRWREG
jgi:hypothetical protein